MTKTSKWIQIENKIQAPLEKVWNAWTTPDHITQWNFASPEWQCPVVNNDLKVGGRFSYRMEAKDGSEGFDLKGVYVNIVQGKTIEYILLDSRKVIIQFSEVEGVTTIAQQFEAENKNSRADQEAGWSAILENFKKYVESREAGMES